ncbi:MAG TPA: hypothetical protein VK970_21065, partial [Candidatus Methylacidiphilales bacterium]|nr:hypothetical protein [Candidatus Methylacidiphilales bacterium]
MSRILTIVLYVVSTYLIIILFHLMIASSNARSVALSLDEERAKLETLQRNANNVQQVTQRNFNILQTLAARIAAEPSLKSLLGKYGVQFKPSN